MLPRLGVYSTSAVLLKLYYEQSALHTECHISQSCETRHFEHGAGKFYVVRSDSPRRGR